MLVVAWGMGDHERKGHPVAGPVLYALLLAVLLHSRIHAVAWAGAACLAAWQLRGIRSWPWWVASIIAGGPQMCAVFNAMSGTNSFINADEKRP